MISFFPDLNVWLALTAAEHQHSVQAWRWFSLLPRDARLIFSRYTNIGLLRLLTNEAVMGELTLTVKDAWAVYDQWLADPRVEFHPEPRGINEAFRAATIPIAERKAFRAIGDCYLLSFAQQSQATLVTFDKALRNMARKQDHPAITPD